MRLSSFGPSTVFGVLENRMGTSGSADPDSAACAASYVPMHQTACGRATGAPTRTPGRFDISVRDRAVETTEGSTALHDLPKAVGGEGSSMIESFRKRGVSRVCRQSGRQGRGSVWPCGVMRVATDPDRRARMPARWCPGRAPSAGPPLNRAYFPGGRSRSPAMPPSTGNTTPTVDLAVGDTR